MKYLFSLLCVLLTVFHCHGQQKVLDSLLQELKKPGIVDSSKINLYNEIAYSIASVDPRRGLLYADSALVLSEKNNLEGKKAISLNSKGVNYWHLGEDSLALIEYNEVLNYHRRTNYLKGQGRISNNIALIHYNNRDYQQALQYHEVANSIFKELGDTNILVSSLINTGVVFLAISDYPKALEYFLEAKGLVDSSATQSLGNIYSNIGLVYKNQNQLDLAADAHLEAVELYRKGGLNQFTASAMANLANVYSMQDKFAEAKSLLEGALKINLEIGNERRIASDYANLGSLYKEQGDYEEALGYLKKADNLYQKINDPLNRSIVLLHQAEVILATGKSENAIFKTALNLQTEAFKLAKESESISRQQQAAQAISETYELLGNPSAALSYFKQYSLLKDSIFNDENEKKITKLQIEYDYMVRERDLNATFEMEKEILRIQGEKETFQTKIYLFLALVLALSFLIIFVFYRRKNFAEQAKLAAEFQSQRTDLEMKVLRTQMNPHFIFNALNSISNFLLKNQADDADYYLVKFAKLIRMILEYSDQKEITLNQELELIRHYAEIESMRLGKKINLEVAFPEEINLDKCKIPPLLLQPLIENSIWHGISKIDGPGRIQIQVEEKNNGLSITIRDNGAGRNPVVHVSHSSTKKSMATGIIEARLELMRKGKSQKNNQLIWRDLSPGLEVSLLIPS
jgi:tetratricopeptide (TPR) repeat protein